MPLLRNIEDTHMRHITLIKTHDMYTLNGHRVDIDDDTFNTLCQVLQLDHHSNDKFVGNIENMPPIHLCETYFYNGNDTRYTLNGKLINLGNNSAGITLVNLISVLALNNMKELKYPSEKITMWSNKNLT